MKIIQYIVRKEIMIDRIGPRQKISIEKLLYGVVINFSQSSPYYNPFRQVLKSPTNGKLVNGDWKLPTQKNFKYLAILTILGH